jgi:hypothetical protein
MVLHVDPGVRRDADFLAAIFAAAFFAAGLPFALAASRPSSSFSISLSMRLLKAPSRKPSFASSSKWSGATMSWPVTPGRTNSTVSLVSPSITVHSMSNFCSTSSAHFQATSRAFFRPRWWSRWMRMSGTVSVSS